MSRKRSSFVRDVWYTNDRKSLVINGITACRNRYIYIYTRIHDPSFRPFFRKNAELVASKSERLKVRPGTGEKREKVLWINVRFSFREIFELLQRKEEREESEIKRSREKREKIPRIFVFFFPSTKTKNSSYKR